MKFLDDVKKTVTSPFKNVNHSVSKVYNDSRSVVSDLHDDAKGITKGAYSMGKDITGGINQLCSPVGLIVVGGVICVVLLSRR